MARSILHIGAHRTGTTSLQRFLHENTGTLNSNEIEFLCPPESRTNSIPQAVALTLERRSPSPTGKLVISEENLLGTMEHNIQTGTLYPNAKSNLERLSTIFQPDVVMLSIRELGDFWTSAILFSLSRSDMPFPSKTKLGALCQASRTWTDVIDDITAVFPKAKLVVREFDHLKDNPKRFLKIASGWPDWNETKLNRRPQNMRPAEDEIVSILLERRDFNALSRLGDTWDTQIFSTEQRDMMYASYQSDLEKLWAKLGSSLLESRENPIPQRSVEATWSSSHAPKTADQTVFLHIGKTGGTFLKSLAAAASDAPENLTLGSHGDTLISTIKKFGRKRKLVFFFRDPQDRFISGFNARLRQGRPTYDVTWTTAEAVAFSFFKTPVALAEALYANDEHLKSAARFAMSSIFHLKHNYAHFLHSPDALRYELEANNILMCCETEKIDANLDKIMSALGLSSASGSLADRNHAPNPTCSFSERASESLRRFWANEFEIFAACKLAAQQMGQS